MARLDFCIWFVVLLLANLVVSSIGSWAMLLSLPLTYCQVCLYAKRLHDIGRSGWLTLVVLGASAVSAGAGALAAKSGSEGAAVVVLIAVLVVLGMVVWLGVAKGEAADNPYGPPNPSSTFGPASRESSRWVLILSTVLVLAGFLVAAVIHDHKTSDAPVSSDATAETDTPESDAMAASDGAGAAPEAVTPSSDATEAAAPATAPPGDGKNRSLIVVNNTSKTLMYFFASAPEKTQWGADRLPGTLASGARRDLEINDGTSACNFDLMGRFSDKSTISARSVDVCSASSFTLTEEAMVPPSE